MTLPAPPATLEADLAGLGVPADAETCRRLLGFAELLASWNRRFNLLSRQDIDRLWPRHIYDSLSIARLIHGSPILDVGSGGGFPGLPLAIACPGSRLLLTDRNARKCRFLELAVAELGLANVAVHHGDAAVLEERFPTIVSRAVQPPAALLELVGHLLAPGGELLAMASTRDSALPLPPDARVESVPVPGLEQPHEVVIIS